MATPIPNRGRFIESLRTIILAIPLTKTDRAAMLAAIQECARCAHNERQAPGNRRRYAETPTTPEIRARRAHNQRIYRARIKSQQQQEAA